MERIKIVQIIPQMELGGAERLVSDIVRMIDKEKFEIKIIALYDLGSLGEKLRIEGYTVYYVGAKHKLGVLSISKIYKILKFEKPDIVHTHLFGADVWGGVAAKLAGIKHLISTEHNLNYNEYGWRFVLKNFVIRRFEKIITISEAVSEYLERVFEIGNDKKIKIYNGILTKNYDQNRPGNNRKFMIGSLGRLSNQKGYDVLIDVLSQLDFEFECRIAGVGELKESLQEKINVMGMASKIKLIGKVDPVSSFYNGLDIYIQPSRWEGLCLAVLEAGASGLPVVVSRTGGLKEIINNPAYGLSFSLSDRQEMLENIKYIREHREKSLEMGQNLKSRINQIFTIENMIKNYEAVYENINSQK